MPNAALFVSPGPLVDGSGNPYAGSKLNFYTTGTSSRLNTYSDSGLLSANANPVVADINGKFGPIYLTANTSYKVVFATSADVTIWTWDPVQGISISATPSVGLLRSYLAGLSLSRNAGSPNTKIDVSAGTCADSTNVLAMAVPAGTIDCGTVGVNGLDAGILVLSASYHCFAIAKVDGTIGLLASTSATSPALPSGYTLFRRLGSVKTDASVHFIDFVQAGDRFFLTAGPGVDINVTASGTSAVTRTLVSIPTGIVVEPILSVTLDSDGNGETAYLSALSTTDVASSGTTAQVGLTVTGTLSAQQGMGFVQGVLTNTSSQIRSRQSFGGAAQRLRIKTHGWIDRRGRDD